MTRYVYRLSAACLFGMLLPACSPTEPTGTAASASATPTLTETSAPTPAEVSAPTEAPEADNGASLKLATVQNLYTAVLRGEEAVPTALLSHDFQHTLKLAEQAAQNDKICIDYDPFTQGQDFDAQEIASSLKTRLLDNGDVQADFSSFGNAISLRYVLACEDKACSIDDLLETNENNEQESFKQRVNACLK